ncbi:Flp pilus assembly protein CpaB [Bacillus daqingensis]|uniref:Flp pilus assembly protein CpaB n=1 Tax=Bacillus daqingensis TaxID=872396 RepID=A0ABV9NWK8_9BACI
MKAKRIMLLAAAAGLMTTGLFYVYMNEAAGSQPEPVETVEAVVAGSDIEPYTELREEMVSTKEVPADDLHPDAVTALEEVSGRFTAAPLREGEIILQHRLDGEGLESDFVSKKLEEGNRAVSISVDYVRSVSNLIEPEDHVDIVLSVEPQEGPVETTVLQEKVRVLAVGERMIEVNEEGETEEEYHSVTFEMKPEEALNVIHASETGSLQLTLHSKLGGEVEEEEAEEEEMPEEETAAEDEEAEEEPAQESVVPVAEKALVREGPSLNANVVTAVDKGDELPFLQEEEEDDDGRAWYYVAVPDEDEEGWISSRITRLEIDE